MGAPQKATGGKVERGGKPMPPRYDTTKSARPRILEAARSVASEQGYERTRLCDITERADISHQGFYLHFANKRHAVAAATSDSLGAMAAMLAKESEQDALWAERLLGDLDRTLDETYPTADGPDRWLYEYMVEVISSNTYEKTKIVDLVEVSGVSHGDFYRRWGGKKPCLQRIYGGGLAGIAEQVAEVKAPLRIAALGEALAAEPDRALLLVRGATYLPTGAEPESGVATQESFPALVDSLVAEALGADPASEQVALLSGAILEVIRSAVIRGDAESLRSGLMPLEGGFLSMQSEADEPSRSDLKLAA